MSLNDDILSKVQEWAYSPFNPKKVEAAYSEEVDDLIDRMDAEEAGQEEEVDDEVPMLQWISKTIPRNPDPRVPAPPIPALPAGVDWMSPQKWPMFVGLIKRMNPSRAVEIMSALQSKRSPQQPAVTPAPQQATPTQQTPQEELEIDEDEMEGVEEAVQSPTGGDTEVVFDVEQQPEDDWSKMPHTDDFDGKARQPIIAEMTAKGRDAKWYYPTAHSELFQQMFISGDNGRKFLESPLMQDKLQKAKATLLSRTRQMGSKFFMPLVTGGESGGNGDVNAMAAVHELYGDALQMQMGYLVKQTPNSKQPYLRRDYRLDFFVAHPEEAPSNIQAQVAQIAQQAREQSQIPKMRGATKGKGDYLSIGSRMLVDAGLRPPLLKQLYELIKLQDKDLMTFVLDRMAAHILPLYLKNQAQKDQTMGGMGDPDDARKGPQFSTTQTPAQQMGQKLMTDDETKKAIQEFPKVSRYMAEIGRGASQSMRMISDQENESATKRSRALLGADRLDVVTSLAAYQFANMAQLVQQGQMGNDCGSFNASMEGARPVYDFSRIVSAKCFGAAMTAIGNLKRHIVQQAFASDGVTINPNMDEAQIGRAVEQYVQGLNIPPAAKAAVDHVVGYPSYVRDTIKQHQATMSSLGEIDDAISAKTEEIAQATDPESEQALQAQLQELQEEREKQANYIRKQYTLDDKPDGRRTSLYDAVMKQVFQSTSHFLLSSFARGYKKLNPEDQQTYLRAASIFADVINAGSGMVEREGKIGKGKNAPLNNALKGKIPAEELGVDPSGRPNSLTHGHLFDWLRGRGNPPFDQLAGIDDMALHGIKSRGRRNAAIAAEIIYRYALTEISRMIQMKNSMQKFASSRMAVASVDNQIMSFAAEIGRKLAILAD